MRFLPLTEKTETEIFAGIASGTLQRWRIDANGVQWYRHYPAIRGVPAEKRIIDGDDDGLVEVEFSTEADDDDD